jgi:hypothetical protein
MGIGLCSDFFDGEIRLAIENGYQQVNTLSGWGYLLPSKKSIPAPNPTQKHGGALGVMEGNHDIFEQAMRSGNARLNYSPEKMLDIRITNLKAKTANFTVQTRIGI